MAKTLISDPIWDLKKFFFVVLSLVVVRQFPSYYLMQFPGKLMNQTLKNDKKLNFGPFLAHLTQIFFVGFTSTSSYRLFQAIMPCSLNEN